MRSYVLFDHAMGYALFQVKKRDEIGSFLTEVQDTATDLARFTKCVKLIGFRHFDDAAIALENSRSCSDGVAHKDLLELVASTIACSKSDGTRKATLSNENLNPTHKAGKLGVVDPKLAASLQDNLGIKCEFGDSVLAVTRGIRLFFHKMIPGITHDSSVAAQLGLSHSYSRAKVQFNAKKTDNMIIQSSCLLEQMDKDINTFCMRIREWYSYHFPELYTIVKDNSAYCAAVWLISDRNQIPTNVDTTQKSDADLNTSVVTENMDTFILENILNDQNNSCMVKTNEPDFPDLHNKLNQLLGHVKTLKIFEAAKTSVGMDINPLDIINIKNFCKRVLNMIQYRRNLANYMNNKMNSIAPNLTAIIGENVGARLITQAGGLSNLVKCPASTLQILGAEKALFRALKTRSKTPKYGIIFNSSFISKTPGCYKGKISRLLAHKCSIAVRLDYFQENANNVIGKVLNDQIEERLAFLIKPSKCVPRSNTEVMDDALQSLSLYSSIKPEPNYALENDNKESLKTDTSLLSKKKKKKSKSKDSDVSNLQPENSGVEPNTSTNNPTGEDKKNIKPKKRQSKKDNSQYKYKIFKLFS